MDSVKFSVGNLDKVKAEMIKCLKLNIAVIGNSNRRKTVRESGSLAGSPVVIRLRMCVRERVFSVELKMRVEPRSV